MRYKVLIADDEKNIRNLLKDYLSKKYEVYEAKDGKEALNLLKTKDVDLAILDVLMPYYDGFSVVKEIRKEKQIPIIMLTAKTQDYDEIKGFDVGADEYIKKPFNMNILLKRVEAILKRIYKKENINILNINNMKLNLDSKELYIDDNKVEITHKEYELLFYFMNNKNKALSRDQILDNIWGIDYFGGLRTVDTHIKRLRKKLNEKSKYLKTIRNVGYMLEADDEINKI
ncbi:MAG: response regulator transcription factor [Peptostreptococcaceae bacterium]|jgi:DNA-binding response OmpR family regulator|nr:response regulator transcription factor [Peptostreptococcaceae bacterium]